MAESSDPVGRPRDWDKAVSAAFLIQLDSTQSEAAKAVGAGQRTVERWVQCSWWAEAKEDARERWLSGLTRKARRNIQGALEGGDMVTTRWIAEKVIPELQPTYRQEHTGPDGEPLPQQNVSIYLPSNDRDELPEAVRERISSNGA